MSSGNPCGESLGKKRLVLDTTICIDLFNGQLLGKVTRLPYELLLPDVIVEELIDPSGNDLIEMGYGEVEGQVYFVGICSRMPLKSVWKKAGKLVGSDQDNI